MENKIKRKPGPKPKLPSEKVRTKHYSFSPEEADFLDTLPQPGRFLRTLLNKAQQFKQWKKNADNL